MSTVHSWPVQDITPGDTLGRVLDAGYRGTRMTMIICGIAFAMTGFSDGEAALRFIPVASLLYTCLGLGPRWSNALAES